MGDYERSTSPKKDQRYTYKDYLTWPNDESWELINGLAYALSPAPKTAHQRLSVVLSSAIFDYLKDKPCEVFAAPFDAKLDYDSVVQPDLSVICD